LRDRTYRTLWTSILMSSFGGQISLLAIPLTGVVLLGASPVQMGILVTMEILPFVLLSLPGGVWLDRVRKLPVYIAGECLMALAVLSVPLAWWLELLTMHWLYAVSFAIGTVHTIAGSAAQIVLMQIVSRERLIEAHSKNALASSTAEVMGPGIAGVLIRAVGAPLALLADGVLLAGSALILRGIRAREQAPHGSAHFWSALMTGARFVAGNRLLVTMGVASGGWQLCHNAALVVQILFATRVLGLDEGGVGLSYVALGCGTVSGGIAGHRISRRIGPGPALVLSYGLCAGGWLVGAMAPANALGVALFAVMLMLFGSGATMMFINFIALRQAVTPPHLLGRMTTTMRWLILLPAGPGAMLGGWIGEHAGLRYALLFAAAGGALLAWASWQSSLLRNTLVLPQPVEEAVEPEDVAVPETQPGEVVP
jgi:MFS family permease